MERYTHLLEKYFNNPNITSYKVMSEGKENTSVLLEGDFGSVILRIWGETHGYMGQRRLSDIEAELSFMSLCADNSIPVPKLYPSLTGGRYETTPEGAYYAVMDFARGESPHDSTPDMITQVATIMATMHKLVIDEKFTFESKRSWPGTVVDMTNDRIAKFEASADDPAEAFVAEVITTYVAKLSRHDLSRLPQGVIHGDIMWENMKFLDGKLSGIFDFDDCRESFFVEDITKTLFFEFESAEHSLFGADGQNVGVFLAAYQKVRELSPAELNAIPLLFITRFLYQVLGYYAKLDKGQQDYRAKIDGLVARYKHHQSFFDAEDWAGK